MSTTTSLKEKAKALSFSTVEGCRRLLAIFTALILVSSYFAYMLACDWGKIKVNDIAFEESAGTGGRHKFPGWGPCGGRPRPASPRSRSRRRTG